MLRAASKLDRLAAKMPADVRGWALAYLCIKYKVKAAEELPGFPP
jgi:hypothetical protein